MRPCQRYCPQKQVQIIIDKFADDVVSGSDSEVYKSREKLQHAIHEIGTSFPTAQQEACALGANVHFNTVGDATMKHFIWRHPEGAVQESCMSKFEQRGATDKLAEMDGCAYPDSLQFAQKLQQHKLMIWPRPGDDAPELSSLVATETVQKGSEIFSFRPGQWLVPCMKCLCVLVRLRSAVVVEAHDDCSVLWREDFVRSSLGRVSLSRCCLVFARRPNVWRKAQGASRKQLRFRAADGFVGNQVAICGHICCRRTRRRRQA